MTKQYKERTITCEGCGREVTGRFRPAQRFCSVACSRTKGRPKTGAEQPCAWCGVMIYIHAYRLGGEHYFCCLAHQIEWQGRKKTEHTCTICSKVFRWSPSRKQAYNIKYCSLTCRDADPDRHTQLVQMNADQQRGHRTRIESIGYELLDKLGLTYLPQHVIGGKFCVDAFIPSHSMIVQFDGDYWHGNPELFPKPDARQRKRMQLDVSQDAYMRACGYTVTRLWGNELEHHSDRVLEHLQLLIRNRLSI